MEDVATLVMLLCFRLVLKVKLPHGRAAASETVQTGCMQVVLYQLAASDGE